MFESPPPLGRVFVVSPNQRAFLVAGRLTVLEMPEVARESLASMSNPRNWRVPLLPQAVNLVSPEPLVELTLRSRSFSAGERAIGGREEEWDQN